MYRTTIEKLFKLKESNNRKPLVIEGALSEQYVCQQLKTIENLDIHYYTNDRGNCEVDFVADLKNNIIHTEVKAKTNLKAKTLKTYCDKHKPKTVIRSSMVDYKKEEWLINLPLYIIETIDKIQRYALAFLLSMNCGNWRFCIKMKCGNWRFYPFLNCDFCL